MGLGMWYVHRHAGPGREGKKLCFAIGKYRLLPFWQRLPWCQRLRRKGAAWCLCAEVTATPELVGVGTVHTHTDGVGGGRHTTPTLRFPAQATSRLLPNRRMPPFMWMAATREWPENSRNFTLNRETTISSCAIGRGTFSIRNAST